MMSHGFLELKNKLQIAVDDQKWEEVKELIVAIEIKFTKDLENLPFEEILISRLIVDLINLLSRDTLKKSQKIVHEIML